MIITPVGADPISVRGSDNKFHVHYELSVFNAAPRAATLTKVETLKASASGERHINLVAQGGRGSIAADGQLSSVTVARRRDPGGAEH